MRVLRALLRGVRLRKRIDLGPVALNITEHGITSATVEAGPWSWNTRTRRHRVDLPGPLHWRGRRRPR